MLSWGGREIDDITTVPGAKFRVTPTPTLPRFTGEGMGGEPGTRNLELGTFKEEHKMNEPEKKELKIEIDEATAQGIYSNLAFITHSEQEFIMDFIFMPPQQPKAKVRSRIVVTPKHAKRFYLALMDNIKKFEGRFGTIPVENAPPGNNTGDMVN